VDNVPARDRRTLFVATNACAAAVAQKTFASPEDAATALVQNLKAGDRAALLAVLGDAGEWISSGDAVADRATREHFVTAYETKHAIQRDGDKATLVVGSDDYPFAFPIVKSGEKWRFDTAAGKDELLARRIGQNELDVIKVLQAIVDCAERVRVGGSQRRRRPRLRAEVREQSRQARRTVLAGEGGRAAEPGRRARRPAPRGRATRRARADALPRLLLSDAQRPGQERTSGAFDYVVRGRAIGGFAVVAYPARYATPAS
jgi:hypothetical protein